MVLAAFYKRIPVVMAAAIWSGTSLSMRDYPVATFLRFIEINDYWR